MKKNKFVLLDFSFLKLLMSNFSILSFLFFILFLRNYYLLYFREKSIKKGEVNEVVLVIILVIFVILLAIGYVIFKIKGIKEAVGLS